MRQLETSALNNQNIAAYLLAHTYTADADRAIFARIHIDQVAGGGDYSAYVTIQAAGAGSHFMEGPITTFTVPAAQTAVGFVSILLPVNNADVVKFYIKGLAGDTATPDIVTRIFELTYLRPTTAGRTLDVTDTGEAGIDLANIHEPTTAVDLSGVTIKGLNDPVDLVSTLKHKAGVAGYDRTTDSLEALGDKIPATLGTDGKALISTDAQDLSATLSVNAKTLDAAYDHAKDDVLTPLAVVDGNVDSILTDTGTTLDTKIDTLDTILDDIHGTDLPAVKADTAAILTDTGTTLDGKIDTIDANVDEILTDTGTTLDGIADAIKAKTDNLPTDPADESLLEAAITAAEGNIRGADSDTIKTISDVLDLVVGTGSIVETLSVVSDTGTPLNDVDVWITSDIAGTTIVRRSLTSASGLVTFRLNPGTYYVWKQKTGYTFTNPEVLTV